MSGLGCLAFLVIAAVLFYLGLWWVAIILLILSLRVNFTNGSYYEGPLYHLFEGN